MTAGLVFKCTVMAPVRLRNGLSNGIDPDNCRKEPARKLPSS